MVWNQKSLLSYFCPAPQGRRKFLVFFFFFFNALVQNFPGATWHLWATPHFTIFCHYGINVWVCSISKYIKTKQSKKPSLWKQAERGTCHSDRLAASSDALKRPNLRAGGGETLSEVNAGVRWPGWWWIWSLWPAEAKLLMSLEVKTFVYRQFLSHFSNFLLPPWKLHWLFSALCTHRAVFVLLQSKADL